MSAAPHTALTFAGAPPIVPDIFKVRCEARACLYAADNISDLHDAVDALHEQSERVRLVAEHGQDAAQAIIAAASRAVWVRA